MTIGCVTGYAFKWVKKDGSDWCRPLMGTIRYNRQPVIDDAIRRTDQTWKQIYRNGGRIVKVRIVEVKP